MPKGGSLWKFLIGEKPSAEEIASRRSRNKKARVVSLADLTEDQWAEIALRFIFDAHPFANVTQSMTIDRIRSEDLGIAIQASGGIEPLVRKLVNDNNLPCGLRESLASALAGS